MKIITQTPEPFGQLTFDNFLDTVAVIVEGTGRKSMATALRLKAQEIREELATVEAKDGEHILLGDKNDPGDRRGDGEAGGDGGGDVSDADRRGLDVGLDQSGDLNPEGTAVVVGDAAPGDEANAEPEDSNKKTPRTRRKGK